MPVHLAHLFSLGKLEELERENYLAAPGYWGGQTTRLLNPLHRRRSIMKFGDYFDIELGFGFASSRFVLSLLGERPELWGGPSRSVPVPCAGGDPGRHGCGLGGAVQGCRPPVG